MQISILVGIVVGIVTVGGVFLKLAYHMGQMAQQLRGVTQAIEGVSEQVKELFEWRYQSAIRSEKGRGRLPRD